MDVNYYCTILMLAGFYLKSVMEMLSSVCSFENIWEPVFERDFSAKPEQENLGELKQELDVDFHKVLNIISFRFILYQGS